MKQIACYENYHALHQEDLISSILEYAQDVQTLIQCGLVSKKWQAISRLDHLWKRIFERDFQFKLENTPQASFREAYRTRNLILKNIEKPKKAYELFLYNQPNLFTSVTLHTATGKIFYVSEGFMWSNTVLASGGKSNLSLLNLPARAKEGFSKIIEAISIEEITHELLLVHASGEKNECERGYIFNVFSESILFTCPKVVGSSDRYIVSLNSELSQIEIYQIDSQKQIISIPLSEAVTIIDCSIHEDVCACRMSNNAANTYFVVIIEVLNNSWYFLEEIKLPIENLRIISASRLMYQVSGDNSDFLVIYDILKRKVVQELTRSFLPCDISSSTQQHIPQIGFGRAIVYEKVPQGRDFKPYLIECDSGNVLADINEISRSEGGTIANCTRVAIVNNRLVVFEDMPSRIHIFDLITVKHIKTLDFENGQILFDKRSSKDKFKKREYHQNLIYMHVNYEKSSWRYFLNVSDGRLIRHQEIHNSSQFLERLVYFEFRGQYLITYVSGINRHEDLFHDLGDHSKIKYRVDICIYDLTTQELEKVVKNVSKVSKKCTIS